MRDYSLQCWHWAGHLQIWRMVMAAAARTSRVAVTCRRFTHHLFIRRPRSTRHFIPALRFTPVLRFIQILRFIRGHRLTLIRFIQVLRSTLLLAVLVALDSVHVTRGVQHLTQISTPDHLLIADPAWILSSGTITHAP